MMQVVSVARNTDGTLTVAYGGQDTTLTRDDMAKLAETDRASFTAIRYAQGSAILRRGAFYRIAEKRSWDAYRAVGATIRTDDWRETERRLWRAHVANLAS